MTNFDFVLLYVANSEKSADFYADLLSLPLIDRAPTFSMLQLREGVMLGLWRHDGVEPAAQVTPGGAEIAFTVEAESELDQLAAAWAKKGITILQAPTTMDFGRTFTAADPDGHRIRVFAPSQR